MTRAFDSARSRPEAELFRAADHVLVVPQGSAVTILDLEQGIVYATTPFGAAAWSTLVSRARPPRQVEAEPRGGFHSGKGRDAWARIAGYLLDQGLIEPVLRGAGSYRGASPIR